MNREGLGPRDAPLRPVTCWRGPPGSGGRVGDPRIGQRGCPSSEKKKGPVQGLWKLCLRVAFEGGRSWLHKPRRPVASRRQEVAATAAPPEPPGQAPNSGHRATSSSTSNPIASMAFTPGGVRVPRVVGHSRALRWPQSLLLLGSRSLVRQRDRFFFKKKGAGRPPGGGGILPRLLRIGGRALGSLPGYVRGEGEWARGRLRISQAVRRETRPDVLSLLGRLQRVARARTPPKGGRLQGSYLPADRALARAGSPG